MLESKVKQKVEADFRLVTVTENMSVLYISMPEITQSTVPVKSKKTVNLDEALEMTGFGLFNMLIMFVTGGCLMCVIIETMGMMFISPSAQCDLGLDVRKKGILNAISFLGIACSSYVWGYVADKSGRKKTLIISLLSSFFVTGISAFVTEDWLFISLRFLNGVLISGASSTVYAYAGEFHDNFHRPIVISLISTFVALANIVLAGIAWLLLPSNWIFEIPVVGTPFRPWRLLVLCYGLPSLVFGLAFLLLPESPKFLMSMGKKEETLQVLKLMSLINRREKTFPITEVYWDKQISDSNQEGGGSKWKFIKDLFGQTASIFSKKYFLRTITVSVLQFGTFALSSGLSMWYPEILNKLSKVEQFEKQTNFTICEAIDEYNKILDLEEEQIMSSRYHCSDKIDENVFVTVMISGSIMAVVYIFITAVINCFGKKKLGILIFLLSAASGITAQYITNANVVRVLTNVVLISSTCIGIINAIVVDLYSTQIRVTALAVSLMFGRLGAVTGSHVVGPIFYQICDYAFIIFMAVYVLLIVLIFTLPIKPFTHNKPTFQ